MNFLTLNNLLENFSLPFLERKQNMETFNIGFKSAVYLQHMKPASHPYTSNLKIWSEIALWLKLIWLLGRGYQKT